MRPVPPVIVQTLSLAQVREGYLANGSDAWLPIVDAHHHFWEVPRNPHHWLTQQPRIAFRYGDYESICCDFLPDDYARASAGHRVMRHVVMEGEWDSQDPIGEAIWMQALAQDKGAPHAMAAQIWLDRDDVDAVLLRYQQAPLAGFVRSVRHKPKATSRQLHHSQWVEPGAMRCPHWRAGYRKLAASGLMFELQTPWWHMDEAVELAQDFPNLRIIVNHAGLPAQRDVKSMLLWQQAMQRLSICPNVMVKISGLGVSGDAWRPELQKPVVDSLLASFGFERCMFASNFPVDSLVASMDTLWSGFKSLTQHLPLETRLALFCDNAVRIYQLE